MLRKHFTALQLHRNLTYTAQNTALLKTFKGATENFLVSGGSTSAITQILFSHQLNLSNALFRSSPKLTTNKRAKKE